MKARTLAAVPAGLVVGYLVWLGVAAGVAATTPVHLWVAITAALLSYSCSAPRLSLQGVTAAHPQPPLLLLVIAIDATSGQHLRAGHCRILRSPWTVPPSVGGYGRSTTAAASPSNHSGSPRPSPAARAVAVSLHDLSSASTG